MKQECCTLHSHYTYVESIRVDQVDVASAQAADAIIALGQARGPGLGVPYVFFLASHASGLQWFVNGNQIRTVRIGCAIDAVSALPVPYYAVGEW